MKKIVNKLQELEAILEEVVAKREDYFSDRTDKWQDSEKGRSYQEKTEQLSGMRETVSEWLEELTDPN